VEKFVPSQENHYHQTEVVSRKHKVNQKASWLAEYGWQNKHEAASCVGELTERGCALKTSDYQQLGFMPGDGTLRRGMLDAINSMWTEHLRKVDPYYSLPPAQGSQLKF
jgi:hypothetical protein